MRHMPANRGLINPYVTFHINNDRNIRDEKRELLISNGYILSDSIVDIIEQFGHYEDIRDNIREIMSERCAKPTKRISELKENLKASILNIINVEQQRIDSLLR